MYPWEEYDEIKIENTQWSQHSQVIFTMTSVKKKEIFMILYFLGMCLRNAQKRRMHW